jgi:hypothetical protein
MLPRQGRGIEEFGSVMVRAFICDEKYSIGIVGRLQSLRVSVETWDGIVGLAHHSRQALLLAHSADLPANKADLEAAAKDGALVVEYTSGHADANAKQIGAGWIFELSLGVFHDLLSRLPERFNSSEFLSCFEAIQHQDILGALAIVSWCVTASLNGAPEERKQEWRRDPRKWRALFKGVSMEDFELAIGPLRANEYPAVKSVLNWIWSMLPPDQTPGFDAVVGELNHLLGVHDERMGDSAGPIQS